MARIVAGSADERLLALIDPGALPKELPYCFSAKKLAKVARALLAKWAGSKVPPGKFEKFSMPRPGANRRVLAIPNPIHQLLLSAGIADNWDAIKAFTEKSSSVSTYISEVYRSGAPRSVTEFDFDRYIEMKSAILARSGRILNVDIQRFYGSIYTHSIPWALHTKPTAKAAYKAKKLKGLLGDKLDILVRNGQDAQTIGIPIGPDTSRVIAEIVAVGIDELLRAELKTEFDFLFARNVDDICLGFAHNNPVENCIALISKCLADFELEINATKTIEQAPGAPLSFRWSNLLGYIAGPHNVDAQRASIRRYFESMFELALDYPKENIARYALLRLSRVSIHPDNWRMFESYMIRVARSNLTVLDQVVSFLIRADSGGMPVDRTLCRRFAVEVIELGVPRSWDYEVAWALLLLRDLKIKLRKASGRVLSTLRSGPSILLTLDLVHRGLVSDVDTAAWVERALTGGVWEEDWLFSYEARRRGWLPKPNASDWPIVEPYFKDLAELDVSFYSRRTPRPQPRETQVGPSFMGVLSSYYW